MKKLFLIICLIIISASCSKSQFIKDYGIKGGMTFYHQNLLNVSNNISYNKNGDGLGYDFEVFAECKGYKKLSFIGILCFTEEGTSRESVPLTSPGVSDTSIIISNRYRYLSAQALAKYNFAKKYGFYIISGIRTDLMLQNYYTNENANYEKLPNNHLRFGATLGTGYEFRSGILLELQYKPNFSRTYQLYSKRNWQVDMNDQAFVLYIGYSIHNN